ncbi:MAG TPA: LamG-like jellyroll fold domain-containing protein [Solirubrobacterales bacterium]
MIHTRTVRRAVLLLSVLLALAATGTAQAEVVPRLADLETRTTSPFEFDQVSKRCATSVASRDTSRAYAGVASLKVHTEADPSCESPFSRGIFSANGSRHLVEGDDFWFGAAIYLPTGFYASHDGYTDLLRVDSYVSDDGGDTPYADRAEINFASWSNDSLYVAAARGGTKRTLIGPLSPSVLPEGKWSWVEVHVRLRSSGAALTELKINGVSRGSSTTANLFAGAAPFNRLRYGIVSTEGDGSGNLTAYFDRASISATERGPFQQSPPPTEQPAPEPNPAPSRVSLWRLDERSSTTAADSTGAASGVYVNGPTLGAPAIDSGKVGTAVAFDGLDDYVEVAPRPALDLSSALTVEAWCKANAYEGSVVQRYGAYELRPQPNGNLIWRLWIGGTARSLTAGIGTVSTGQTHHLVGTYDGATMRLYLDGVQVASQPMSGPVEHDPSEALYIGANAHAKDYFGGVIDDVSIYSTALSAGEVFEHFRSGTPLS